MDNNVYPLFVLFQNKIFGNIYMNKIYVYKNRLYQIEFKKFQFDTAPFYRLLTASPKTLPIASCITKSALLSADVVLL